MSQIKIVALNQSGELVDVPDKDDGDVTKGMTQEQADAWNDEMSSLKTLNFICFLWHLAQGSIMLTFSYTRPALADFTLPVFTLFTDWTAGYPVQTIDFWRSFCYLRLCSFFALLSALAHGLVLVFFKKYERDLRRGLNRFRWYEYALSSSLMVMLVFWLWGNFDWVQLTGVFVINMCMNLFGDCHELLNAGKKPEDIDWTAFRYGWFAGMIPWLLVWFTVGFYAVKYWEDLGNGADIPVWFWVVLVEYFLLFQSFPFNLSRQYKQKGKFKDELYPLLPNGGYLRGEKIYQWLSLIAKTILLWQIAIAAWSPDDTYSGVSR